MTVSILSLHISFKSAVQQTSGFLVDVLFMKFSVSFSVSEICKRFLSVSASKSLKGQPPSYVTPLIPVCNNC